MKYNVSGKVINENSKVIIEKLSNAVIEAENATEAEEIYCKDYGMKSEKGRVVGNTLHIKCVWDDGK